MPRTAAPDIPVALANVHSSIVSCERCARLRLYCGRIAEEKRRAYRLDTYWGRPVPGFGDPAARLLLIGLAPAAHGANRTGRMFTGDGTVLISSYHPSRQNTNTCKLTRRMWYAVFETAVRDLKRRAVK